ncbi:MAG TPA: RNA polymerase sigma factor [Acidobacteriota bacterium]|nr:RNA polymerase sigma factor [Acidobacteriota bacterium]
MASSSERGKADQRGIASEALVDQMISYQEGTLKAFEMLYYALKPRLFQYLLSLTFEHSRAEDLLQETFLQLHRSRRTYQPRRPVMPWAFAIARHVFLMDRRAGKSRQQHEVSELEDVPELPIPAEVEQLADRELVRKALSQVSEPRREALLMHHVWGFSFGEIGALLGIRKGTAKLRAYRGMQDLRQELGVAQSDKPEKGK